MTPRQALLSEPVRPAVPWWSPITWGACAHARRPLLTAQAALGMLAAVAATTGPVCAQDLSQIFRAVNGSVVVVRTSEREVSAEGQLAKVGEVGSGVLISSDGKVMTAAHVVHLADRIVVEFLGGERVDARILASEADADVSLLQLESVPAGARVATSGDSDRVQIGEPVFIIGAPYGIGHTLSAGHFPRRLFVRSRGARANRDARTA